MEENAPIIEEQEKSKNKSGKKKKYEKKLLTFAIPGGVILFSLILFAISGVSSGKQSSEKSIPEVSGDEIQKITEKLNKIADQGINPDEQKNSAQEYVNGLFQKHEDPIEEPEDEPDPGLENPEDFLNLSEDIPSEVESITPKISTPVPAQNKEERDMIVYSRLNGKSVEKKAQKAPAQAEEESSIEDKVKAVMSLKNQLENHVETVIYNQNPPVKVFEGEFLEGIVLNQIQSGVAESPVVVSISKDFFDTDQCFVVIPAGSRVIGEAGNVTRQDQARMILYFHRIILPNGVSVNINKKLSGLSEDGSMGVVSKVNEHIWKRYSSAILFGVLNGLGGFAQNKLKQTSGASFFVDRTSSNFDQVSNQIFQQYSNIAPTITVKAGHKVKIYISQDIVISPYIPIKERSYAK